MIGADPGREHPPCGPPAGADRQRPPEDPPTKGAPAMRTTGWG